LLYGVVKRVHLVTEKTYIPAAVRRAVETRDGSRCVYCGSRDDMTLDHVIPEADGGPTVETNLVCCCAACNTMKGVIDVDLFAIHLERRGFGRADAILLRIKLRLEMSRDL
jgi:5-methylcytosine-specific restriction endonuclease McrA